MKEARDAFQEYGHGGEERRIVLENVCNVRGYK